MNDVWAASQPPRRRGRAAGFSLIEILLAAMILAVGCIMLLPAFTTALYNSRVIVDNSVVIQLAQNAEAYLRAEGAKANGDVVRPFDSRTDTANFTNARVTSDSIQAYVFGADPANSIPNRHEIRVHGNVNTSLYYWNLLYRFPHKDRSVADLWILVCKRQQTGEDGGAPRGVQPPASIAASGSAGGKTFSSGSSAFLNPGSCVVTDQGEILHIVKRDGSTLSAQETIRKAFSSVFIVKFTDASERDNACVGALHMTRAF